MDKRLGAQYYTIREACQTIEDFDDSCKKVSEMGYKIIQLSAIGEFDAKSIKEITDKYGLQVVCTHRAAKNYLENLDAEIEFHKTLGCKVCGLGAMPGFNANEETIEEFAKNFKPVCEKLKKHGLVFAYHNHSFEFVKIDGRHAFDILVEKMASDNFKFILDVFWLAYSGINPAKFIREHKDMIPCIHFKDLKVKDEKPCIAEVGQGNIDWDDIIDACKEANVEFALVEQDICEGDPFDSLRMSYSYLNKKGFI